MFTRADPASGIADVYTAAGVDAEAGAVSPAQSDKAFLMELPWMRWRLFSRPGEDLLDLPPYAARCLHKALLKIVPVLEKLPVRLNNN